MSPSLSKSSATMSWSTLLPRAVVPATMWSTTRCPCRPCSPSRRRCAPQCVDMAMSYVAVAVDVADHGERAEPCGVLPARSRRARRTLASRVESVANGVHCVGPLPVPPVVADERVVLPVAVEVADGAALLLGGRQRATVRVQVMVAVGARRPPLRIDVFARQTARRACRRCSGRPWRSLRWRPARPWGSASTKAPCARWRRVLEPRVAGDEIHPAVAVEVGRAARRRGAEAGADRVPHPVVGRAVLPPDHGRVGVGRRCTRRRAGRRRNRSRRPCRDR